MAAKSTAGARPSTASRLPCDCDSTWVREHEQHGPKCKGVEYPKGCGSLDCGTDCLYTDKSCDGGDDD